MKLPHSVLLLAASFITTINAYETWYSQPFCSHGKLTQERTLLNFHILI